MVPADDESTSTNEAEKNTSTQKNFVEKLKFWKRCNKDENKPEQLTPMPPCLMKWWIPIPLALFLLALGCFLASIWHMPLRPVSWQESKLFWPPSWPINPFWPPSWPFNYHWPSKDAMALCTTIAGAGFAFATWQQRSHDNAAKAKQAQAAVERDDYWKRREQAYSLLSSPNASIRLGAIELLIELANLTTENQKQHTYENQQFIQHITTALCAQVRHEGLNIAAEGTQEEHALIQSEIITRLLDIANQSSGNSKANAWHRIRLNLSQTKFYTPIHLNGIRLNQELNFSNSLFLENLRIEDTRLDSLNWEGAELRSKTIISKSKLRFNAFPSYIRDAQFSKTTFSATPRNVDTPEIILPINSDITTDEPIEKILFEDNCTFQHKLKIHGHTLARPSIASFKNCIFGPLEITGRLRSLITFEQCQFGDIVNIHDIDYEMGHSSSPDEGSLEQYNKYGYIDNELGYWLAEFPGYNPDQETNINIKRCTFTNSSIVGSTILTNLRCYTPYSTEFEDFEYDTDIISFTENSMSSSTDLSLRCINQNADYARGYSFKLVEESHQI